MTFDAKSTHKKLISWIREWFDKNGKDSPAVIGISGGADSTICAALLSEALGKDRVIGIMMPNKYQDDILDAIKVCDLYCGDRKTINIGTTYTALTEVLNNTLVDTSNPIYTTNTPARLRMVVLYGIAATINGRVCNTCNYSEDFTGWSSKFGDSAGDFSPIAKLTKTEVRALGDYMKVPKELVYKTPSDGMCGLSDEDKFGFTYDVLDNYIRTGEISSEEVKQRIDKLHSNPNTAKKILVKEEDTFQL